MAVAASAADEPRYAIDRALAAAAFDVLPPARRSSARPPRSPATTRRRRARGPAGPARLEDAILHGARRAEVPGRREGRARGEPAPPVSFRLGHGRHDCRINRRVAQSRRSLPRPIPLPASRSSATSSRSRCQDLREARTRTRACKLRRRANARHSTATTRSCTYVEPGGRRGLRRRQVRRPDQPRQSRHRRRPGKAPRRIDTTITLALRELTSSAPRRRNSTSISRPSCRSRGHGRAREGPSASRRRSCA